MPFDAHFEGLDPVAEAGTSRRELRGLRAYQNGLAGEAAVEQHYLRNGYDVVSKRWRGASGEIDLIVQRDACFVMVEVKCSDCFETALSMITAKQMGRVSRTSLDFLASNALSMDTDMRIDVALVNGLGQVDTIENVTLH